MPKFNVEQLYRQENEKLTAQLSRKFNNATAAIIEDAMAFAWAEFTAKQQAGSLPDLTDETVVGYIYTIARHEALALVQGGTRKADQETDHFEDLISGDDERSGVELVGSAPSAEDLALDRVEASEIGEWMKQLKPNERKALGYLAEKYSYEAIMEAEGWTYTKVNRLIAEGRKRLRELRDEAEGGES